MLKIDNATKTAIVSLKNLRLLNYITIPGSAPSPRGEGWGEAVD